MQAVGAPATALLDALPEPSLLLDRDATIVYANRAFLRLTSEGAAGRSLADFVEGDLVQLDQYLQRCSGSGDGLAGSLKLSTTGGGRKMNCRGNALRWQDGQLTLLRLYPAGERRFAALSQTVAELKEELGRRRRSEALLEETVRDRELLLRELEHRVKNNTQMLSALLQGAERETTSTEAKATLKDASTRFAAVSAVQQLLYRSSNLATIRSRDLLETVTGAIAGFALGSLETHIKADPIDLPIDAAVPIGLILNELLTNAAKYGRPAEGTQRLLVEFESDGERIRMTVQDNGPGFDLENTTKRASGLGLVRGLLRQLGGSLEVSRMGGSRCDLTFPMPQDNSSTSVQR